MASYWFPRVRGLVKHNRIKYLVFSSIIIQIFFFFTYYVCLHRNLIYRNLKRNFVQLFLYMTQRWPGLASSFFFFFQENSTLAVLLRDIEIAKDWEKMWVWTQVKWILANHMPLQLQDFNFLICKMRGTGLEILLV